MSTFSSVVRKPGQKLTPRTGSRRNVQRNISRHAAPASLTPDSQRVSPDVSVPAGRAPSPLTAVDSVEASTITAQPTDALLTQPAVVESIEDISPAASTPSLSSAPVEVVIPSATNPSVTIIHPTATSGRASRAISDSIPTISVSTSSANRQNRRLTNEPTPSPSEASAQPVSDAGEYEDTTESSRKRRKTGHAQSAVRTTPPPDPTSMLLRNSPRARRSESRTSDALLHDATTQAAAVSELANSIENRARSQGSRSARGSVLQTPELPDEARRSKVRPSRKKTSKSRSIQELAQSVVESVVNSGGEKRASRRKSRVSTPENAEEREIDPEEVSMADLVKNTKIGRKSETEKKMEENWAEIKQRRKEDTERRWQAARGRHKGSSMSQEVPVGPVDALVPTQIIVNGQIVVAAESREVAFGVGVEEAVIQDADVALEDDRIYKHVHQGTLGKNAGRRRATRWDEEQTDLFYRGLRMFGTDFSMIANLFPDWADRRVVKAKYIIEERANPVQVQRAVAANEGVSLEDYAAMTNQEYEDPDKLMAELEEQEKRLREEDEKRRANEGYVVEDGADVALPSTERDHDEQPPRDEGADEDEESATPAAAAVRPRDRISALADAVVHAAVTPKRRQGPQQRRGTKEPTGPAAGRGRQTKKGRRPAEGVEERIGPIDEVDR